MSKATFDKIAAGLDEALRLVRDREPKTLDDKINAARLRGERYTPTMEEWEFASDWQKQFMTWPREAIDWIRREDGR